MFHQEKCPGVVIVGVDPVGSILALPDSLNENGRLSSYKVMSVHPPRNRRVAVLACPLTTACATACELDPDRKNPLAAYVPEYQHCKVEKVVEDAHVIIAVHGLLLHFFGPGWGNGST